MDLYNGDCLEVLKTLPDNSVDSLVTDPPAGVSFMSAGWDSDKGGRDHWIAWLTEVMVEAKRVLKPGGHALVWALPRTSHWTTTAIENAGFEIRDIIHHLFGVGMPKGLDISKAIDRLAGAERQVVGQREHNPLSKRWRAMEGREDYAESMQTITAPATEEAQTWEGWNTALKPAAEHWILARKPIAERNIAANVLTYGTGGLNIDATRVGAEARYNPPAGNQGGGNSLHLSVRGMPQDAEGRAARGRWPANVVVSHTEHCRYIGDAQVRSAKPKEARTEIENANTYRVGRMSGLGGHGDADGLERIELWECTEDCPARLIDQQSGQSKARRSQRGKVKIFDKARYGVPESGWLGDSTERGFNDEGGASRFFMRFIYVGKASPAERGDANNHPTVKNLDLMQYLILLVTPPNGTVLDCFMGSGSTGIACAAQGFNFIGIEQDQGFFEIAVERLRNTLQDMYAEERNR